MTTPYATAEGCRWCGTPRRDHGQRWHALARWHGWTEPTREQIHERMRARLAAVFERRWRTVAAADPGHCTYPEAVPGWRAQRAAASRTRAANGPRKRRADLDAPRPAEPITRTHRDTGGMIVRWPKPDVPPASAPVTVAEIRERHEPANSEAEMAAALAAELDMPLTEWQLEVLRQQFGARAATGRMSVLGPGVEIRPRPRHRWWDPRTWWRR